MFAIGAGVVLKNAVEEGSLMKVSKFEVTLCEFAVMIAVRV